MPVKVGQKGAEGQRSRGADEENHGGSGEASPWDGVHGELPKSPCAPCLRGDLQVQPTVTVSNAAAKIVSASAISASVTTSGGIQRITLS